MRAASIINGLSPESVGLDPLSEVVSELVKDLHTLQGMGLDLSSLLKEEPKRSKAEQAKINGSKSSGPVTAEGKAASSRNALKHGMYSRAVLLPGEDVEEFDAFVADLQVELAPTGSLQKMLVQRAAELGWKLRRLPAVEGAILESARIRQEQAEDEDEDDEGGGGPGGPGGIGDLLHQLVGQEEDGILLRLQRYEVRLEKSLERSLKELRLVKKEAREVMGLGGEEGARPRTAIRGTPAEHAAGSFGTGAIKGAREAAVAGEAALPARGPSAAPQDDVLASGSTGEVCSSAAGLGSFGTDASHPRTAVRGKPADEALGSFRTNDAIAGATADALGSFRPNGAAVGSALGSFGTNDAVTGTAAPVLGSFGAKAGAALRRAAHAAAPVAKTA